MTQMSFPHKVARCLRRPLAVCIANHSRNPDADVMTKLLQSRVVHRLRVGVAFVELQQHQFVRDDRANHLSARAAGVGKSGKIDKTAIIIIISHCVGLPSCSREGVICSNCLSTFCAQIWNEVARYIYIYILNVAHQRS